MAKLQFEFEMTAADDQKSNTIMIRTITDENGKKYYVPEPYQPYKIHTELINLPEFKRVAKTLQKRGQRRNVWIRLAGEQLSHYKDDSGNVAIDDYLLKEIPANEKSCDPTIENDTLKKLLEKLCERESTRESSSKNLSKIYEKVVLEKFEEKRTNASQWLQIFENECDRLDIRPHIEKIEALRLFLDEAGKDWFNSMLIKYTLDNSVWETWKEDFLRTFADKGWSAITYALNYKYFAGSLLEYALRKERLLLESNRNMDHRTLIDLIANGLPISVREKIDRQLTKSTSDLYSELRKYENIERKIHNSNETSRPRSIKTDVKQPCRTCEKRGKKNRYHPENLCWFKEKTWKENTEKNRVNNSILEIDNIEDPKN